MNIDFDVLGISLRRNPVWDREFALMGFGDIGIPAMNMTLRGCALMWRRGRVVAFPPKVPGSKPGELGAIDWAPNKPFAERVALALYDAYRKMGGEAPPAPTEAQTRAASAERRIAEKRAALDDYDVVEKGGVTWIGLPKPEDDSGVLRTLRAEAEICDRAGL